MRKRVLAVNRLLASASSLHRTEITYLEEGHVERTGEVPALQRELPYRELVLRGATAGARLSRLSFKST